MNSRARVIISMSVQTLDEGIGEQFEPKASAISERIRTLREAKRLGFATGIMAMPVLPGISDSEEAIEALATEAKSAKVDFLCFGGLTLRPGVQKDGYFDTISKLYPQHLKGYQKIFGQNLQSGRALSQYYARLEGRFRTALARQGIPGRIPREIYHGYLPLYTEIAVALEHSAYERGESFDRGNRETSVARAIQGWARARFSKSGRSKGFCWEMLEQEFRTMILDGSLANVEEIGPIGLEMIAQQMRWKPCR
jgi:hypothetical protein